MRQRASSILVALLLLITAPAVVWAGGQKEGAKTSSAASAGPTKIVVWDFFSGGDGVRWQQIINDFNSSQTKLQADHTTLTWGAPFYTKVHTAIVAGDTPDMMSYHISHFPSGILAGDLSPIPNSELKPVGLSYSDFNPVLVQRSMEISKTYGKAGVLYGIPLDTHTSILYYNKDILQKAGVLGPDGLPTGLSGIDNFTATLKKIKDTTGMIPMAMSSANDEATVWRMWYTLFSQQGGRLAQNGKIDLSQIDTLGKTALQQMVDWTNEGLVTKNAQYPAAVALFSSGKAAFMFNGDWEVPTMVDLQKKGQLPFKYGVMPIPQWYSNQDTWADSHNLAIPNNTKNPESAQMRADVMTLIAFIEKHAIIWAGGGHIPAYLPVLDSAEMKNLVPNNEYSVQAAKDVFFGPISPVFGVGNPAYDDVGNFLTPALLGQLSVGDAIAKFTAALQSAEQQVGG